MQNLASQQRSMETNETFQMICNSAAYDPKIVGAGLLNTGNTCFINAVLQCLVHTTPLLEKLRESDHYDSCPGYDDTEFCSLCALKNHADTSLYMSGYVIVAMRFSQNLNNISSSFNLMGQQEDAHEFFTGLLNSLDAACHGNNQPPVPDEDTLIKQIFGGRLRSQLRCVECGHISESFESLKTGLSLPIVRNGTLKDSFRSFTAAEMMEDYNCDGCKTKVSAEKKMKLDQSPQVLAIHLKRFENNGYFVEKIDDYVKYPMKLKLSPYLSSVDSDQEYQLYAIIVHEGVNINSGHYFSLVRSSRTQWHRMEDAKFRRVTKECAENQKAYMLFYIKKGSSSWFSTIIRREETFAVLPQKENNSTLAVDYSSSSSASSVSDPSSEEVNDEDEEGQMVYDGLCWKFRGRGYPFTNVFDQRESESAFKKKKRKLSEFEEHLGLRRSPNPSPPKSQCISLDDTSLKGCNETPNLGPQSIDHGSSITDCGEGDGENVAMRSSPSPSFSMNQHCSVNDIGESSTARLGSLIGPLSFEHRSAYYTAATLDAVTDKNPEQDEENRCADTLPDLSK